MAVVANVIVAVVVDGVVARVAGPEPGRNGLNDETKWKSIKQILFTQ